MRQGLISLGFSPRGTNLASSIYHSPPARLRSQPLPGAACVCHGVLAASGPPRWLYGDLRTGATRPSGNSSTGAARRAVLNCPASPGSWLFRTLGNPTLISGAASPAGVLRWPIREPGVATLWRPVRERGLCLRSVGLLRMSSQVLAFSLQVLPVFRSIYS